MFELPITLGLEVKSFILKSFNHFWYDPGACANKIRQAIELIVKEKGGRGSNLHQEIDSLNEQLGGKLTETILDAYRLLVDVLNQLYPNETEDEKRRNLIASINEKRGLKNI